MNDNISHEADNDLESVDKVFECLFCSHLSVAHEHLTLHKFSWGRVSLLSSCHLEKRNDIMNVGA